MREWKIYQNFQKNVFLSAKFRQDNRIDPILDRKEKFLEDEDPRPRLEPTIHSRREYFFFIPMIRHTAGKKNVCRSFTVTSAITSAHDSRMCFKFQCLPPNVLVIP